MDDAQELERALEAQKRKELDEHERKAARLRQELNLVPEASAEHERLDQIRGRYKPLGSEQGWLKQDRPSGTQALLTHQKQLFMPRGKVCLMVAPGGTGKTSLLAQLAVNVVLGDPWLGEYELDAGLVHSGARVLLILAEEDEQEMRRKLYDAVMWSSKHSKWVEPPSSELDKIYSGLAWLALAGIPCPMLIDNPITRAPDSSPFSLQLRQWVEEGKFDLVICDPLSRFAGAADENDNARATRLIQEFEALASLPSKPTVVIAHHTNKGALNSQQTNQGNARGASALVDGARWCVSLEPRDAPDWLQASPDKTQGWGGTRLGMRLVKNSYGPRPEAPLELFWPSGEHLIRAARQDELLLWELHELRQSPNPSRKGEDRKARISELEQRLNGTHDKPQREGATW